MSKVMIIAIGGAGCNMAEYCKQNASSERLKNAEFVFADTETGKIAQLDKKGYRTLTLLPDMPTTTFASTKGAESIVILAGLGGNTGTRFVESAAKAAQSAGVKNTLLVVTMPFHFEGDEKAAKAQKALSALSDFRVITLNNEDLTSRYPDMSFFDAFEYSDKEVLNAIESEFSD